MYSYTWFSTLDVLNVPLYNGSLLHKLLPDDGRNLLLGVHVPVRLLHIVLQKIQQDIPASPRRR